MRAMWHFPFPKDLINPVSALSGKSPVLKETKHWFLPLQKYESWLREWILEGHKDDWKSNVYGQCKSWLDQGLQPRAMTRDLDWGVKVPLPDSEGKVLYVWFDAPIGYISATKEYFEKSRNQETGKRMIGNCIGRIRTRNSFILLAKTILYSIVSSFRLSCMRMANTYYRNVPPMSF